MARPSEYNEKICEEICAAIAQWGNIIQVLESKEEYPAWDTFRRWKNEHEELSSLYTHARQDKSEAVDKKIDDIMEWIKNGTYDAGVGRVLIDTLKWKAAKYYPKMFWDKVDMTSGGEKLSTYIITTNLHDKGSES